MVVSFLRHTDDGFGPVWFSVRPLADSFLTGLSALSAGISVGFAAIGPGLGQGTAAGYSGEDSARIGLQSHQNPKGSAVELRIHGIALHIRPRHLAGNPIR